MTPKALITHFNFYYELKYGSKYPVAWAKHTSMFKRLLQQYDAYKITEYIRFYLQHFEDRYVAANGYSIELFIGSLPKIIAQHQQKQSVKQRAAPKDDYERLQEARRQLQDEE